jgi:sialate O-acetylesterase
MADNGEKVTITFEQKKYTATPDATGKWMVTLPAMKAGGPYEMNITGNNSITMKNIRVGDVWLASGQYNMERNLSWTVNNLRRKLLMPTIPRSEHRM